ncbi:UDP-N-acetylmuramate dehydrogenase [Pedobacter insulae]|uniref:UDP-N-acetylenolpyruvoylglucosamine reductase n=1 Tax=Pedobacter insulae TaxID=414048 RepID=A0A1I2ZFK1_9SPHI|nr:UDP-N-acetylmuramate dehydrogenase [Pedobacter insulae]SFH35891.1 UDP-N-acetylmuramate dehydrogenase [Pedobacter insulae]
MSALQQHISLKPYNTFGIQAHAESFVDIQQESDLKELLTHLDQEAQEILVLGGGSNMLFTKDFKGLVIKVSIPGISCVENGDEVMVTAGAGVVWNDLVNFCVARGFAGLENLTLIPGTVGASPIQNIGAYGVELKDVFNSCRAFELATGKIVTFNHADCKFGYRESIFKNELKGKYIITSVTFKLNKQADVNIQYGAIKNELFERNIKQPTIADVSKVVAAIRVSKLPDPSTIGNAGSFFKNPVIEGKQFDELIAKFPEVVHYPAPAGKIKVAAGWLIEQCGFKGKIVGETGTWKNQALVLVNHGKASGQEVYNFSEQIIDSVRAKFGVLLSREVNIF